jgi:hypothetical protein
MLLAAAVFAAGCGGDENENENGDGRVFTAPSVDFTFEYPESWVASTKPDGQVLGQVSPKGGTALNAIKVRKTSDQELGTERYLAEFQRDFAESVGDVEKREETVGDLDVGVLEFDDSVEQAGERVDFHSASYFFAGGGKTWQLECIADTDHLADLDEACEAALDSISFDT